MEECYMDDRATEGASLQILISQASDLSNPDDEVRFLDAELSLLQSSQRRAQMEVELISDAIQYLIESDTSECSTLNSQEQTQADSHWAVCSMGGTAPRRRLFADQYDHLFDSSNTSDCWSDS
jgi:hypothetical protein